MFGDTTPTTEVRAWAHQQTVPHAWGSVISHVGLRANEHTGTPYGFGVSIGHMICRHIGLGRATCAADCVTAYNAKHNGGYADSIEFAKGMAHVIQAHT